MEYNFNFIGEINDNNFLTIMNWVQSINDPNAELIINISSSGGSVTSGIVMYNFLKQVSYPITTHNLGEVSSSAILLYLAGDVRTSENIAKFMIHPICIDGGSNLPYHKVQELLNQIDAYIQNYLAVVKQVVPDIEKHYDVENYLKSDSLVLNKVNALTCGIVTTQ